MNEKDLRIIRYLAGAIFLALALISFLYTYPVLFASASSAYAAYSSTYVIGYIVSAVGAIIDFSNPVVIMVHMWRSTKNGMKRNYFMPQEKPYDFP